MIVGTGVVTEVASNKVSNTKFHHIFGRDLSVALEATLEVGSGELDFDCELFGGKPNQDLLFRNGDCWRAYFPAVSAGDIKEEREAVIRFIPWFNGPKVLFYRLCLRGRPLFQRDDFRWLAFGRRGEEKSFGFNPAKPFINLDFFSRGQSEFKPLYVRVETGKNNFIYLIIEAEWSEEGPKLMIRRVSHEEIPPHLAA